MLYLPVHRVATNLLFCGPPEALLAPPFLCVPQWQAICYGGTPVGSLQSGAAPSSQALIANGHLLTLQPLRRGTQTETTVDCHITGSR